MSNSSPPARRRPSPGAGESAPRPARKAPSTPRPAPPATGGPKLLCVAGPKSGEEYALEGEEFVIGRATDNPISIPDTSVSRRHAVVRKLGAGWTVGDLGSGNGTLLNGEPLANEEVLKNGDVISMGDTELQFSAGEASNPEATMMMPSALPSSEATMMIPMPTARPPRPAARAEADEAEAPPARPARGGAPARPERGAAARPERGAAARPERARPARGGAARGEESAGGGNKKRVVMLMVGVLVVAGTGLAILKKKADDEAAAEAAAAEAQAEQIDALRGRFQDAKNLIREGKWKEAKEKLTVLYSEAPNPDVKTYLERAEKEIPNEENLVATQRFIDKKELSAANAALSKVTEDTQMFEQRRKLVTALKDAADAQTREAKTLLDAKNPDYAKTITDDVLGAFPEHRDAKIINEQAAAEIAARNRPVYVAPKPDKPWEAAIARYSDGDLSGAVALANACVNKPRCKQLLGQMTEFGTLYKRVEDLDAKGLSRLLALDRSITEGRGSKMARSAGTRAANIFYKSATAAKAAGQFGRAVDNAKKALQADPSHSGAKNIMEELKGRAKDVYLSAYSIKDTAPDEALTKFKDVVAMTAPDDEYHQKAKSWIEKLSR